MSHVNSKSRVTALPNGKQFSVWVRKLFRRKNSGLNPVFPVRRRVNILKFLHDFIGHWSLHATRKLISESFSWPRIQVEITLFIHSCDAFQRMKPISKYIFLIYAYLLLMFFKDSRSLSLVRFLSLLRVFFTYSYVLIT